RLRRRECESLQERQGLQSPRQDRLHVEGEDVVERRAFEWQESEPAETTQQLFAFLLRLLVPRPHARLQFPRPLPEPPQDVLRPPEFLLVLQPVFLQELVLRLDALRFPRMRRPLELRTGELRIAQRLTPSSPPASSLPAGGPLPPIRPRAGRAPTPNPSGGSPSTAGTARRGCQVSPQSCPSAPPTGCRAAQTGRRPRGQRPPRTPGSRRRRSR